MKNLVWRVLLFCASVGALSFTVSAQATDNFVEIRLPRGMSFDLPKNWVVISNNMRITLDTKVESGLDLAGIDQAESELTFAANYYEAGRTVGIVNNRFYPKLDITQDDAKNFTVQEIKELDVILRDSILKSTKAQGIEVVSWEGTERVLINSMTAFVSEYHRKALKGTGVFRVRLIRVLAGERSFTFTASYHEDKSFFLSTITDRIISSLRLAGMSQRAVPSTGSGDASIPGFSRYTATEPYTSLKFGILLPSATPQIQSVDLGPLSLTQYAAIRSIDSQREEIAQYKVSFQKFKNTKIVEGDAVRVFLDELLVGKAQGLNGSVLSKKFVAFRGRIAAEYLIGATVSGANMQSKGVVYLEGDDTVVDLSILHTSNTPMSKIRFEDFAKSFRIIRE